MDENIERVRVDIIEGEGEENVENGVKENGKKGILEKVMEKNEELEIIVGKGMEIVEEEKKGKDIRNLNKDVKKEIEIEYEIDGEKNENE